MKKFLTILLACTMCIAFTCCKSSGTGGNEPDERVTEQNAALAMKAFNCANGTEARNMMKRSNYSLGSITGSPYDSIYIYAWFNEAISAGENIFITINNADDKVIATRFELHATTNVITTFGADMVENAFAETITLHGQTASFVTTGLEKSYMSITGVGFVCPNSCADAVSKLRDGGIVASNLVWSSSDYKATVQEGEDGLNDNVTIIAKFDCIN